jgi:cation diffusion facilitator family transporter
MKNHSHLPMPPEAPHGERFRAARKSTWVSILVNLMLTTLQVVAGYLGHSQALMADGMHSLSDLLADILVLSANYQGNRNADNKHPYGHARIETAATLILGVALAALGVGLLIAAGMRLQHPAQLQQVHPYTLWIAITALLAKEGLFRYMLAVATRVRSQMLVANAWHARSDAASSLVVLIGISGNLMGYTFLDLVAALVVGVIIAHIGIKFAFAALLELIDTGLADDEVEAIRATLLATPGVCGLHGLRTRKMADSALVDAHIMVDPKISVSEGHYIAEAARQAVLRQHPVLDVMVHIDPEDDLVAKSSVMLPNRETLLKHLEARLGDALPKPYRAVLHYLDGRAEIELFVSGEQSDATINRLRDKCAAVAAEDEYFRGIRVHRVL